MIVTVLSLKKDQDVPFINLTVPSQLSTGHHHLQSHSPNFSTCNLIPKKQLNNVKYFSYINSNGNIIHNNDKELNVSGFYIFCSVNDHAFLYRLNCI